MWDLPSILRPASKILNVIIRSGAELGSRTYATAELIDARDTCVDARRAYLYLVHKARHVYRYATMAQRYTSRLHKLAAFTNWPRKRTPHFFSNSREQQSWIS